MKRQTLTVYSKFCLTCVWPEEWVKVQRFASKNGYTLDVERTTYHPKRHERATEIWGGDDYRAFLVTPKGHPLSIMDLAKCLTEEGKWRDDLQGLRRTKDAFGEAEPLVADSETKPKVQKRRKGGRRKVNAD